MTTYVFSQEAIDYMTEPYKDQSEHRKYVFREITNIRIEKNKKLAWMHWLAYNITAVVWMNMKRQQMNDSVRIQPYAPDHRKE